MPTALPTGITFGDAPSVNGQNLTVSRLLQSPKLIERRLAEGIQPVYWADKIFPSAGSTPSGAIVVERWTPELISLDRLEEELAEGTEVPRAGISVGDIETLEATEHGIGYVVTDKHVRRNQRWIVDRREAALAFTLADGANRRAMAALTTAIAQFGRTFAAPDWSAVVPDGSAPSPRDQYPHSTVARVIAEQKVDRIPFGYDTMLVHPLEAWRLKTLYEEDLEGVADAMDLDEIIEDTTGIVPHGKPILVASTGLGGYVEEDPTTVEVIPDRPHRQTLVDAVGSGLYFVDNEFGALQLDGTADEDVTP